MRIMVLLHKLINSINKSPSVKSVIAFGTYLMEYLCSNKTEAAHFLHVEVVYVGKISHRRR